MYKGVINGQDACVPIIVKRRNLPHWHKEGCLQFVTFHLGDSLPASVRDELLSMKTAFLQMHPEPWTEDVRKQFNSMFPTKVNEYLDAGYGDCWFRRDDCAKIMEDTLLFFDGHHYILHHYVVMPNHVHVLVELLSDYGLDSICHSWKSYSAGQVNKLVGRSGKLWHSESWDRMIRNEQHYDNVVNYINKNIKSGGIRWMRK